MVAFAYQVAIADPICAAPSCDALSAAGGSYMPAEPITAGAACYPPMRVTKFSRYEYVPSTILLGSIVNVGVRLIT